jgi:hypothetical protein
MKTKTDNYVITRDHMMSKLERAYPNMFMRTTEEFYGEGQNNGGIWLCGEGDDCDRNGKQLFDYYSFCDNGYEFGVVTHLSVFLNRNGWRAEWNDAGTIMLWMND